MRVRATEQGEAGGEGGTLFVLRFAEEIDTLRPKRVFEKCYIGSLLNPTACFR